MASFHKNHPQHKTVSTLFFDFVDHEFYPLKSPHIPVLFECIRTNKKQFSTSFFCLFCVCSHKYNCDKKTKDVLIMNKKYMRRNPPHNFKTLIKKTKLLHCTRRYIQHGLVHLRKPQFTHQMPIELNNIKKNAFESGRTRGPKRGIELK